MVRCVVSFIFTLILTLTLKPSRSSPRFETARTLDLADAARLLERSPRTWFCLVYSLVAVYFSEQGLAFVRASLEAAARGFCFPAVFLRGRFGWRARARSASLQRVALIRRTRIIWVTRCW